MGSCNCDAGQGNCDAVLPQINQGTSLNGPRTLNLTLRDRSTGNPIDLSTASAIVANFPSTNSQGYIQKTLGSGITVTAPGQLGQCAIVLAGVDVAALASGIISFTVYVTNATLTNEACQFLNAIQVNSPPFAGA